MNFSIGVGIFAGHPPSIIDSAQRSLDRGLGKRTVALPWSTRSMLYEKIHSEAKTVSYADVAEALTLKDHKIKEITEDVTYAKLPLSSKKLAIVDRSGDVFLLPKKGKLGKGGAKDVFKAYKINDFGKFEVWADASVQSEVQGAKKEDNLANEIESPYVIEKSAHQIEFTTKKGDAVSLLQPLAEGDLQKFIKANPELKEKQKAKLLLEAAKGIKALHDKGIMHRDIKPANILVYKAGGEYHAKVADLGCAVQKEEATFQECAELDAGPGTPYYAPKKAFTQNGSNFPRLDFKWTKSADIYSFGKTLGELLKPTKDSDIDKLSQKMMGEEANRPDIDEVIERLELILA